MDNYRKLNWYKDFIINEIVLQGRDNYEQNPYKQTTDKVDNYEQYPYKQTTDKIV